MEFFTRLIEVNQFGFMVIIALVIALGMSLILALNLKADKKKRDKEKLEKVMHDINSLCEDIKSEIEKILPQRKEFERQMKILERARKNCTITVWQYEYLKQFWKTEFLSGHLADNFGTTEHKVDVEI
jgi:DNA polymerase sigma